MPLTPAVVAPVLRTMAPLTPEVPESADVSFIAPLLAVVEEPDVTSKFPPKPDAAAVCPAVIDTLPPVPISPEPTVSEMFPLFPSVA